MKKLLNPIMFLTACILAAALFGGCSGAGEETFRNAKVIALSGSATLSRDGSSMDVYEGLVLKGGDQITTGNGRVDLKLDEDKFLVLESGTVVTLELEGDPQKGAIRLHQTQGTLHHTIENPLQEGDCYEVHTPDAVMAVRGTQFSTLVSQTEGGSQTTADVQEGSVEMTPNNSQDPSQLLGPGDSATAGTGNGEGSRFLVYCPACGQEVESADDHRLSCGTGHHSCDTRNHGTLDCGHLACEEGDHETVLACGNHYGCADGDHAAKRDCGHFVCAEGEHETLFGCGHHVCQGGSHDQLKCGHYACTEGDHSTAYSCGHYVCRGGYHGSLDCGHRACRGGDHSALSCGHYACTEGDHSGVLTCGHLACAGGYHYQLDCGHEICDGNDHTSTYGCGHKVCRGGAHGVLSCGYYACSDGHGIQPCGHCLCDDFYEDHSQMGCGHFGCNPDDMSHQLLLPCGSYECMGGGHECCYICGSCICTGEHGDGLCDPVG